jgi:hypothetical protein
MTPLEYFRLLAPEFASVSDGTFATWLTVAQNTTNTACLDAERANMANALYAAHLLWVTTNQASGSGGGLGAIKREKEGDLEREYGEIKGADSWLTQSPYGLQYNDLTRACYGLGIMTRVPDGG